MTMITTVLIAAAAAMGVGAVYALRWWSTVAFASLSAAFAVMAWGHDE